MRAGSDPFYYLLSYRDPCADGRRLVRRFLAAACGPRTLGGRRTARTGVSPSLLAWEPRSVRPPPSVLRSSLRLGRSDRAGRAVLDGFVRAHWRSVGIALGGYRRAKAATTSMCGVS